MMTIVFSILGLFVFLCLLFPVPASAAALPALKVLSTPSCPACAQMYRVVDEIDSQYSGKLTTEKVNLYEHRDIAQQYNVRYVPHLLFVDASGSVVKEKVGYASLEEVLKTFQEAGIDVG
ncbi:MAG: thioredoxin family protein [Synergistaceae bacterium]|jgi:thioredoxin-like negative regulator of GroEL|nr:thioredoxin family protein [Synergistaceae bacterium]